MDKCKLKNLLILALSIILIFALSSCGENPETNDSEKDANTETEENGSQLESNDGTLLSFVLTAGEAGEYGDLITFNEGTECEETFYVYHVPAGTYTVTNIGSYMGQINIYSDETHITEEGWEEPAEAIYVKLLDIDESDTFTIEDGQYIEIHEPDIFKLEMQ